MAESLPRVLLAGGIKPSPRSPPPMVTGTSGGGTPIPGGGTIPRRETNPSEIVLPPGIGLAPGIGLPPPAVPIIVAGGERGDRLIPLANDARGRDSTTVPASGSPAAGLVEAGDRVSRSGSGDGLPRGIGFPSVIGLPPPDVPSVVGSGDGGERLTPLG